MHLWNRAALFAAGTLSFVALSLVGSDGATVSTITGPTNARSIAAINSRIQTSLNKREDALIVNVHSRLVEECMRDKSYRISLGHLSPSDIGEGKGFLSRLEVWLFEDLDHARRSGYGIHSATIAPVRDGRANENAPDVPSKTDLGPRAWKRYLVEYFGREGDRVGITELDGGFTSIPGGGCLGQATKAIWGNLKRYLRLLDARSTADSQLWLHTIRDDHVRTTLDQWRTCVAERGHDPQNPYLSYLRAAEGNLSVERSLAVADVLCKKRTNLVGTFAAEYVHNGRAVLAGLGGKLDSFQRLESKALGRANRLISVPRNFGQPLGGSGSQRKIARSKA
jgi:hypothetical protein